MKYAGFLKGKVQSARFLAVFTVSLIIITAVLAPLAVAIPFNPTDTFFSGYGSPGNPTLSLAPLGELSLQHSGSMLTWSEATDTVDIDCRRVCEDDTYTGLVPSTSTAGTLSAGSSEAASGSPETSTYETTQTTSTRFMPNSHFSDLGISHWAQSCVSALVERGIIEGYKDGSFRPAATVTRAEFVKMICLAQGWTLIDPAAPSFNDIPSGTWEFKYVETAKAHNAISGYPDGNFGATNKITRAEIVVIITKAMNLTASASELKDISGHWAENSINSCVEAGIVKGYQDTTFRPNNTATRAEAAKAILGVFEITMNTSV
ncbi:MAG: S-layer homology domain-containing protein [Candidatus Aquicultor sp.]